MRTTALIRLYPREWRERYGDEMCALLEQHKTTPVTIFDLLLGALDAHVNPGAWRHPMSLSSEHSPRLRTAAATPFEVFPVFFFFWFIISRGDDSWRYLKDVNPFASAVYNLLYLGQNSGSELSAAFLVISATEFFVAVILARHAVRSGPSNVRQMVLRLLPLAACLLVVVAAFVRGRFDWLGTMVSVPLVMPLLIGLVVSRAAIDNSTTRLLLVASILVAVTMIATWTSIVILQLTAVIVLRTPAWPLQLVPGLVGICVVAIVASRSLWFGLKGSDISGTSPGVRQANP